MTGILRRLLGRHLGLLALERFAAGEARGEDHHRIVRHLEECASCRARLQWLRALQERIEDATRPEPPEDLEERILAQRASGVRVILPVHEPGPGGGRGSLPRRIRRHLASHPVRNLGAAAAVLLVSAALAAVFLVRAPEAGARWSELEFESAAPGPRDRIRVTYRPDARLAGEERLVLRGRVSAPASYTVGPPPPRRLAVLRREDGLYRGSFALPEGAVYAQVAVEDSAGRRVDDRGGRLWHVHVHEGGRPARDALWTHALLAADWEDGDEAVRQAIRLYPDDPRLRASLLSAELEVLTRAQRDSALRVHRDTLARLARALEERGGLRPRDLAGLVEYARTAGDTAAARDWTERLVGEHPRHPEAMWYRVPAPPGRSDPDALRSYLAGLEALWRDAGPHPAIASPGFWAARQLGDPERVLEWAEREAGHPGWITEPPGRTALRLAEVPAVRTEARERLRRAIRRLDDDSDGERPLGRTVEEHRRERREAARPLLVALGESLLADGDRSAALDTLRVASGIGWSRAIFRRLAELELEASDTLSAVTSLARAAAPRFEPMGTVGDDSITGPELVSREEWELLRVAARDEMHRRLLSRSVARPLHVRPVRLYDAEGRQHTLQELAHGTVTLVAFWEPWSGPAVRDLPRLRRVTYLVRALGGEVVVITECPPGERISALLEEADADPPLYYDFDRRASEAFRQYGAPEYFVLDFDLRIRFADSDLDDVVAQVDALLNEPRLLANRLPTPVN